MSVGLTEPSFINQLEGHKSLAWADVPHCLHPVEKWYNLDAIDCHSADCCSLPEAEYALYLQNKIANNNDQAK